MSLRRPASPLLLFFAATSACAGQAPVPTQPAPAQSARPDPVVAPGATDGVSPQRVLRLAARCPTARGQAVPVAWRRDSGGGWKVKLRWPAPQSSDAEVHPGNTEALPPGAVSIDPAAGTCDGHPVEAAPQPGDVALEAILALAERCTDSTIDRVAVRVDGTVNAGRISIDPEPGVFHSLFLQIDTRTGACSVDRGGVAALTEVAGPDAFTPWLGL